MENNTFKQNTFVLKEDGKIYYMPDVPKEPKDVKCTGTHACTCASLAFENGANRDVVDYYDDNCPHAYQKALQSAIDNGIEVSNTDDVLDVAFASDNLLQNDEYGRKEWKFNSVYPLNCRVEKRAQVFHNGVWQETKVFALVTFPEDKRTYNTCPKKCEGYPNSDCHCSYADFPEDKPEPEKREHWVNLYRNAAGGITTGVKTYPNKDIAFNCRYSKSLYVDSVKIWEEEI